MTRGFYQVFVPFVHVEHVLVWALLSTMRSHHARSGKLRRRPGQFRDDQVELVLPHSVALLVEITELAALRPSRDQKMHVKNKV